MGMYVCNGAICMPCTMCVDHKDSFVELMLSFSIYMGLNPGPQAYNIFIGWAISSALLKLIMTPYGIL